ncbi:MAG: gephyrin-like molybdotransferase Glp [Gemmatimonadota bacterium]
MEPVSYEHALDGLMHGSQVGPPLRLPLDAAAGQFLAENVVARFALPRWPSSSMDGFAVAGDAVRDATPEAPARVRLAGGSAAGEPTPPALAAGTAWGVATGGRIPPGTDTVIRQEDTSIDGADLLVYHARDVGRNVRAEGGDVQAGQTMLAAGTALTPGVMALLAALGVAEPIVYRRPRVALLCSGDELAGVDHLDAIIAGERIADVNTPMLTAMVREAGGVPVSLGMVPDRVEALVDRLARAADADLIITAGGISVGPHDHVPEAMARLGATVVFRRVWMRPGGPMTVCRLPDGRLWAALPGNPISAWTTFVVLARPVIREMLGDPVPRPHWRAHRLADAVPRHPNLDLFVRVRVNDDGSVAPTGPQESWRTSALAGAERIVRIPAGAGRVAAGELVDGIAVS